MINQTVLTMIIGYALGCFQTSYILGKLVRNIDIREHGSGNAGTSNTTTILGLKYGVIVGTLDILKGFLAVVLVRAIYPEQPDLAYLAGIMAILGHIFPFYMRFRGGKGVATLVGITFGLGWKLGVLFALLVIIPALLTDYIVAGSFGVYAGLPVATHLSGYPQLFTWIAVGLFLLCLYLHRENIRRILKKEELKISAVLWKK